MACTFVYGKALKRKELELNYGAHKLGNVN